MKKIIYSEMFYFIGFQIKLTFKNIYYYNHCPPISVYDSVNRYIMLYLEKTIELIKC